MPPRVDPPREAPLATASRAEAPAPPPVPLAAGEVAIYAPMPGIIVRYEKNEGDQIKAGEIIVVFEAMKMENTLPSPVAGRVKKIALKKGDKAAKDSLLAVIEVGKSA